MVTVVSMLIKAAHVVWQVYGLWIIILEWLSHRTNMKHVKCQQVVSGAFFNDFKIRNYSLKKLSLQKLNTSIFDVFET